jgi:hypothetical protein
VIGRHAQIGQAMTAARKALEPIEGYIDKAEWDKCRTTLNNPPLGFQGPDSVKGIMDKVGFISAMRMLRNGCGDFCFSFPELAQSIRVLLSITTRDTCQSLRRFFNANVSGFSPRRTLLFKLENLFLISARADRHAQADLQVQSRT